MKALNYIVLGLLIGLLGSCSHLIPAKARKMPIIKVLHDGKVLRMGLEKYVASVLAGEVHASWPKEALKAQAIAARTFALLRMSERKTQNYHIRNSVMDQVLKTKPAEVFIQAAVESQGLVLTLNGKLAESSFHSTCGGKTADAKTVWGRSYPHLISTPCGYCQASPTFKWEVTVPTAEMESKFAQKINDINIVSRSADGRVDAMDLRGDKTLSIKGHEFRMALGPMKVKSTAISKISKQAAGFKIEGHGFGHGVGLCQYGALGMAKAGKSFLDIVKHYYPHTAIKKLY